LIKDWKAAENRGEAKRSNRTVNGVNGSALSRDVAFDPQSLWKNVAKITRLPVQNLPDS